MTLRKVPCRNQHFISVKELNATIESILDAVSYSDMHPVFILQSNSKQFFIYKYERYLNTYHQKVTKVEVIMTEGFHTCIKSKNTTFLEEAYFNVTMDITSHTHKFVMVKLSATVVKKMRNFVIVINTSISVKRYFAML